MQFTQATKSKSFLRLAINGPSGGGKTYTAMLIAKELGERFALIDTEHGTASKYAGDVATFDTLQLHTFSPETYIDAIEAAEKARYPVLVIDSLSHAWDGVDGALELVDKVAKKSTSGNKFTAWADVTPMHRRLVEAILAYPGHVIATMRVKTEWVLELNERGKQVPVKKGLAPIQRAGIEYEFDVVGDIDLEHEMVISKSRCSKVAETGIYKKPGKKFAQELLAWLNDGVERVEPVNREPSTNGKEPVEDFIKRLLPKKADFDKWKEASVNLGGPIIAAEKAMAAGVTDAADLFTWAALNAPKIDAQARDEQQQEAANATTAKVADQLAGIE